MAGKPVQEKTGIIDKLSNLYSIFRGPEIPPDDQSLTTIDSKYLVKRIYSTSELSRLPGGRNDGMNPSNEMALLLEHLKNISSNTKSAEDKLRTICAINPEINRAKEIYVASVMSPNDLQSNLVKISVEEEAMPEPLKKEVDEYLDNFFNKQLKFGEKLAERIGEYTYMVDAKPVMILPRVNVTQLGAMFTRIEEGKPLTVFNESEQITWSTYQDQVTRDALIEEVANEAYGIYKPILDASGRMIDKEVIKEMTVQTVKVLDTRSLAITSDLSKVSGIVQKADEKRKGKSLDIMKRMYDTYQGLGTNILELTDVDSPDNTQPIEMDLPPSAVIPLIIPGDKKTRLGYYVLLDEWMNPLSVYDSYKSFQDDDEQVSKHAFFAMFTGAAATSGINGIDAPEQRYRITQSIFSIAMKSILRDKMKSEHAIDLPLGEYDALSKFLFHQMLNKNRTTILFVPADLIVYYCDGYKDDGTGLSKTSAVEFVLTLRTILVIAGVMGSIRAAIDKDNIEVSMGDEETDYEQVIELIRKTVVDKKALNFGSPNPAAITRSMADASVTVTPKNIKGLNLEISRNKDNTASDYRPPEDNLLTTINSMYQDNLGVPPSSLNKLSEDEFAKSVTTNNIIFSNQIRKVQARLEELNHQYLSLYLRFSTNNQKDLITIYRKHNGKDSDINKVELVDADGNKPEGDKDEWNLSDNEKAFLKSVIVNIKATLPAPNISITKSELEDLQAEIEFLNTVIAEVYSEDALPTDDSELKDFYKMFVGVMKADLIRELMEKSSYHKSVSFPDISSVDVGKMADMVQITLNKKHGLVNYINALKQRLEANNTVEDPDNPGGSDDELGGDDDAMTDY